MPRKSSKDLQSPAPSSSEYHNMAPTKTLPNPEQPIFPDIQSNPLSNEELDIFNLISRFLLRARHGEPMLLTTFKSVWTYLHFSYIFEAIPHADLSGRAVFIQKLYSIAISCIIKKAQKNELMLALCTSSIPSIIVNQTSLAEQQQQQHFFYAVSREDLDWLSQVSNDAISLAGFYCLYCLYYAQPGNPSVQIRLSIDSQDDFLDALKQLQEVNPHQQDPSIAAPDAPAPVPAPAATSTTKMNDNATVTSRTISSSNECALMVAKLRADHALALGWSDSPDESLRLQSIGGTSLAPGVGIMNVVPRADAEDAALLREVKFHLDSTLTGLGTGHLDQLCMNYKRKLDALWDGLAAVRHSASNEREKTFNKSSSKERKQHRDGWVDDDPGECGVRPEGIADLSMGKEIHTLARAKGKEVQLILRYGRNYPSKLTDRKNKDKRKKNLQKAPTDGEDATAATFSVNAVRKALQMKENARQKDIRRRERGWALHMGMDENDEHGLHAASTAMVAEPETDLLYGGVDDLIYEDMPSIPGYQSMFQSRGGGCTSSDGGSDESVDKADAQEGERKRNGGDMGGYGSEEGSENDTVGGRGRAEDDIEVVEKKGCGVVDRKENRRESSKSIAAEARNEGKRAKRSSVMSKEGQKRDKQSADDYIRDSDRHLALLNELIDDM